MAVQQYVLAGSGLCTGIATLLSAVLIQQHMQYFSKPLVQSKIVGILWMVPIYSIDSWLSLSFKDYALYLDMIRDCYEAYVLYLFLALLVAYLGDGDEQKVIELLERQPRVKHVFPFSICNRGYVPHGAAFLKFCKFGTMQYIVLKPTMTLAAIIMSANDVYSEGTFALNKGWLYYVVVMNISVGYAFYCLGLFYIMLHDPLEEHNPVPKFLCIKAVLFLSFWQGVIIAGLVRLNLIHEAGEWTTHNVALAIQDVLICFEMMVISFFHRYAFPFEPYVGAPSLRSSLLEDHFAHYSALRDFNEVMPVLLPSHFRPGPAQSTERLLPECDIEGGSYAGIECVRAAGTDDGGEIGDSSSSSRAPLLQQQHHHHMMEETKDSSQQILLLNGVGLMSPNNKHAAPTPALGALDASALDTPPWRLSLPPLLVLLLRFPMMEAEG